MVLDMGRRWSGQGGFFAIAPRRSLVVGAEAPYPDFHCRDIFARLNGVSMVLSIATNGAYLWLCARTIAALREDERVFLANV